MEKIAFLSLVGLVALGGSALAEIGTIDDVPAATLLLPYFEVDFETADGITTLFSVNNATAAPQVAHVTVWTDWSIPVIDFDIYLTGYDVQTLNLRDLIRDGILPRTGPASPPAGPSPLGPFSAGHDTFGGTCSASPGQIPNYNPISPTFRSVIQAALSGQPIPAGQSAGRCAGADYGDGLARGYVTIDNVSVCSQDFPNDPGYFVDGGQGTANNLNTLWGDWFIVDAAKDFAQGETLVHIEALDGLTGDPGTLSGTHYYRYSAGADNREALGNQHAVRYLNGGVFTGGTDLLVWRDSGSPSSAPVVCGTVPSWGPLSQDQITAFDEEEQVVEQGEGPSGFDPGIELPFPWETQRVSVATGLSTPGDFGWLYLDLDSVQSTTGALDVQSWVTAVLSAHGRFSIGLDAMQLNNLTAVD